MKYFLKGKWKICIVLFKHLLLKYMNKISLATFECTLPFFSRFRNSEDRRNFISAGAAAGKDQDGVRFYQKWGTAF